jgi:hypothetical protein
MIVDLYQKGSVFDLERHLERQLRDRVTTMEFDPASISAVTDQLKEDFRIDVPTLELPEELEPAKQSERVVHGTQYMQPFSQQHKVLDVVYELPVTGFAELLDFSPQTCALNYSSDPPSRSGKKVVLRYTLSLDDGADRIKQRVAADIGMLRQNIAGLQQWATAWNGSLERRVLAAVSHRADELRQRNQIGQGLKIRL